MFFHLMFDQTAKIVQPLLKKKRCTNYFAVEL